MMRISEPQMNIEKFRQVCKYILAKTGNLPSVELLYFIDFDYYELFEEQLMGLKYVKTANGMRLDTSAGEFL
jgi:hypothetical protein